MAIEGIDYRSHFPPPDGYLDGPDIRIAYVYIDGVRRDHAHRRALAEASGTYGLVRRRSDETLMTEFASYENRLDRGDEQLAHRLANTARSEVEAVARGERLTVPGQEDLLPERSAVLRSLVEQSTTVVRGDKE